jgi:hypothetical protein
MEEEAKRGRLELGRTIQTWLRRSRPAEECGSHRNPHPALDANCNLNMVADDRAIRPQVVHPGFARIPITLAEGGAEATRDAASKYYV